MAAPEHGTPTSGISAGQANKTCFRLIDQFSGVDASGIGQLLCHKLRLHQKSDVDAALFEVTHAGAQLQSNDQC